MELEQAIQQIIAMLNRKDFALARQKIEGLLKRNPGNERLLDLLGECLWHSGETDRAFRIFTQLARSAAERDALTEAIGYLRKAGEVDPENSIIETMVEAFSKQTLGIALTPEVLKRCSLFDLLDAESFKKLALLAKWRVYMPGQILIRAGDKTDKRVFVLLKGHCEVRFHQEKEDLVLATLKPGEIFGEVSFLTNRPRTADVYARDRVEVLEIPGQVMSRLVQEYPKIRELLQKLYQKHVEETLKTVKKAQTLKKPGRP